MIKIVDENEHMRRLRLVYPVESLKDEQYLDALRKTKILLDHKRKLALVFEGDGTEGSPYKTSFGFGAKRIFEAKMILFAMQENLELYISTWDIEERKFKNARIDSNGTLIHID